MVAASPIINKEMIYNLPNVIILNQQDFYTSKFDYYELRKKFNGTPFCRISNIIYSKDKKTCILYITSQSGSFTVEIKTDDSGQWNSIIYTQETIA